ncbi:uncharacterized protein [Drosophila bipectinata]|uniref:uncharacterized protein n=1 Tax=Drosophila bipectinata TaxID=42026 RepID=UPI001C8903A7|nr:gibberellin 20 oxidase 1 [Drosophila bipectinata]
METLLSRNAVPIIDLANCNRSGLTDISQSLGKALSEKGYALLINHGISNEKIETSWQYFDKFLELPETEKVAYERSKASDGENHGYVSPGMERFDGRTTEFRHAYNICKLDAKHLPEKPLQGFTKFINSLTDDFNVLGRFILEALALSLDVSPLYFLDKHSYMLSDDRFNLTTLRLLYYPPVDDTNPSKVIRCGAHADYCTFTLLAQDSEGGLEVKLRGSEEWQRVGHLPGALFINCGETMALWTNQRYHALQHRVVVPEDESSRKSGRHSIAYFCHPDSTTLIDPKELQNNGHKLQNEKVYNAYEITMALARGAYSHNYT